MTQAQAGSKSVDNQAEPSNAPALKKTFEQVRSKRASAAQPSQLQLADPPAEEEVDAAEERDTKKTEVATDSSGPFAWNVWLQAPITPEASLEAGVNAASSFPETATPAATEQATQPTPSEISQFSPAASQGKDAQGAKLAELVALVTPSSQSPTPEPAKAASAPVTETQAEKASSAKDVQIVTAPAQLSEPGQKPADGTGSAKSALQMHNAAETGQSAKQLVQPLPGKPAKAASFDPVSESTASARLQSWVLANPSESVTISATPDVEASSPARVVHQAELEIRTQAVSMKQLQSDAISVVLKPDGQTELHLQLRMQDNQVHVLAECKRGDVSALNAHWGELQKNLSQQGIRLAPLQESFSSSFSQSGASSGQFQSMEQQPRERQQFPEPETPLPVSPRQSTNPKSSAPHRPNRLWESWA